MTSNANQSKKDPSNRPVLPSFRELFSEYVVQDEHDDSQRASAPRPTDQGNRLVAQNDADLRRQTMPATHVSPPSARSSSCEGVSTSHTRTSPHSQTRTPQHSQTGTSPPPSVQQPRTTSTALPSEEKKHICTICGKGFSRASSLTTHYNSHTGDKPFECPYPGCGSRFSVKSNMLRHYRTHTATE